MLKLLKTKEIIIIIIKMINIPAGQTSFSGSFCIYLLDVNAAKRKDNVHFFKGSLAKEWRDEQERTGVPTSVLKSD